MTRHPLVQLLLDGKHDARYLEELEAAQACSVSEQTVVAPAVVEADLRAAIELDGAVLRLRMNLAEADMAEAVDWRKLAALPSWDEVAKRRAVVLTPQQCRDRLAEYGRRCRQHDQRCLAVAGVRQAVAA